MHLLSGTELELEDDTTHISVRLVQRLEQGEAARLAQSDAQSIKNCIPT